MSDTDNLIQRLRRAVDHALTFSDDVIDDRAVPFDDLAMRDRALSAFDAELRLPATASSPAPAEPPPSDDDGLGGDEPFCEHGNLLDSEDCDECVTAHWKLTDEITAATTSSPAAQPKFEAKLLGFGEGDRIKLCEPCLRQAIADHLVSYSSALPAATCGPARPDDGSECLYGVCPRPRDGCSEYCWQHHKSQCAPAEPLQPTSDVVHGWITGNQYRERGRYEGGKGGSGEPWYVSDSGTHWSAFDVQFFPDHDFNGVPHRNDPNLLLCDFVFHNRRCDSTKEWHDKVNAELAAPPLQPTGEQERWTSDGCGLFRNGRWITSTAVPEVAAFLARKLNERTPPTTPPDAAMRAVEEIVRLIQDEYEHGAASVEPEIAAIITRHLVATPAREIHTADNEGEK